jgi:Mce-associated membrane protein
MAMITDKETSAGEAADTTADPQSAGDASAEEPPATSETDHQDAAGICDAESGDTDTDTDTEPGEPELSERHRARWLKPPLLRWHTLLAATLIIAALAGLAVLGWTVWHQRQITRAAHDAQQTAVAYAQTLTSIDSGKIDDNFTAVLNGSTGDFKDMYTQASMQLRQLLLDNKASAHGVVVDSAVQSATTDKVIVLLFVDQTVTNTNVPDPRIDRSRVKMTMANVDGSWRASKVELP